MFTFKLLNKLLLTAFATFCIAFTSCNNGTSTPIEDDYSKLAGLIDVDTARIWQQTYTKSINDDYVESLDYKFSSEFTIPLERLKKYIEYYENYATTNELKNPGLRVYIGVRPPNTENHEKKSVETIFIAPTATNARKIEGVKSLIEQHENVYTFKAMNLFGSGTKPY